MPNHTNRIRKSRSRQARQRDGSVSVEMAMCMPILFLMFMGSLDLIRYNLLRNIVTQAAYEGARSALVKGAAISDVTDAIDDTMSTFNSNLQYTVVVNPSSLPSLSETISVTVNCDLSGPGWIVSGNILGTSMQETMTIKNL